MKLTDRAYQVVESVFENYEGEVLLQLRDRWPLEYANAVVAQKAEDPDYDGESTPNLSLVCEQIKASDEERFLSDLQEITDSFS